MAREGQVGFDYSQDADRIVTVTMDMDGQSANTMSPEYHRLMGETLDRLEAEAGLAGVVIASAKKTFFAGGDLHGLLAMGPADQAYRDWIGVEKGYLRRLEKLQVPVVAAINGAALGGGLEICLGCTRRVILDTPAAIVGLPEVTLGLLPGAGGVVRMAAMLGVETALPLLLSGRALQPREAFDLGLVDELVADPADLVPAAKRWIRANPGAGTKPWDRPGFSMANPVAAAALAKARADLSRKTRGLLPAPERILDILDATQSVDFDAALAEETAQFCSLIGLPETKASISTFFFAANAVRSGKLRPKGDKSRVTSAAVLGAGMMGAGIASVTAGRGIATTLTDQDQPRAEAGKAAAIAMANPKAQDQVARLVTAEAGLSTGGFDLIVEAVHEDIDVKHAVIRETFGKLGAAGIYGTNTSTLPIAVLAEACPEPERFVGLHFFSPVPKMPLVEIIQGERTSEDTLRRAYDFAQQLGKTPIVVCDSRGFFTSRVFSTYLNESLELLCDGMDPAEIERAAFVGGMPVPPLQLHDEVTISLNHAAYEAHRALDLRLGVEDGFPVANVPLRRIAREMTEMGRIGRKAGHGFYDYAADGTRTLWPGLSQFRARQESISLDEARDRMLYIQSIETLRCLAEGVLRSEEEANLGSILGIGFPKHTGGTLQYIRGIGIDAFAARAEALAARWGARFHLPSETYDLLRDGAAKAA